jgi:hypothetical protein
MRAKKWMGFALSLLVAVLGSCGGVSDEESRERAVEAVTAAPPPVLTWGLQQTLQADDGAPQADFGGSIALSGDTLLIGSNGAAYVFVRQGELWQQQQKLTTAQDCGGGFVHVALSGDTALVSCPGHLSDGKHTGSVYVFTRAGTAWSVEQELVPADVADDKSFGGALAVEADSAVIGALGDSDGGPRAGAVYVFTRTAGSWTQQAKLTAASLGGSIYDQFGRWVALSGDTVLASGGGTYAFVRSGTSWSFQALLTDQSGGLALRDDRALVARPYPNGTDQTITFGETTMFLRSGATWSNVPLWSPVQGPRFHSGSHAAMSGELAVLSGDEDDGDLAASIFSVSDAGLGLMQALEKHDGYDFSVALGDSVIALGQTAPFGSAGRVLIFTPYAEHEGACSSDGECVSGHCVEGVCCNRACDGECRSCLAAKKGYGRDGLCEWIPSEASQTCREGQTTCWTSLYGPMVLGDYKCDYARGCSGSIIKACGSAGCREGACLNTCDDNYDCSPIPDLPSPVCINHQCVLGGNGAYCYNDRLCNSMHCLDDICCDAPCTGSCEACKQALTGQPDGVCAPVLAGTDPHDECSDSGTELACEHDGMCDGAGACVACVIDPSGEGGSDSGPDTGAAGASPIEQAGSGGAAQAGSGGGQSAGVAGTLEVEPESSASAGEAGSPPTIVKSRAVASSGGCSLRARDRSARGGWLIVAGVVAVLGRRRRVGRR